MCLRTESGRDGHFSQHNFKRVGAGKASVGAGKASRERIAKRKSKEVQRHAGRRRRVDVSKPSGTLAVDDELTRIKSSGRWPSTVMSIMKVQE